MFDASKWRSRFKDRGYKGQRTRGGSRRDAVSLCLGKRVGSLIKWRRESRRPWKRDSCRMTSLGDPAAHKGRWRKRKEQGAGPEARSRPWGDREALHRPMVPVGWMARAPDGSEGSEAVGDSRRIEKYEPVASENWKATFPWKQRSVAVLRAHPTRSV